MFLCWNISVEAALSAEDLKRLDEARTREDTIRNKADLSVAAASAQKLPAMQGSTKAASAIVQEGIQASSQLHKKPTKQTEFVRPLNEVRTSVPLQLNEMRTSEPLQL